MILVLNRLTLNTDNFEAISIDESKTSARVVVHTPTKAYEVYDASLSLLEGAPFSRCIEIIKYFYSCVVRDINKYPNHSKDYCAREDKLIDVVKSYHTNLLSNTDFMNAIDNIELIKKSGENQDKLDDYIKTVREIEEKYRRGAFIDIDSLLKYSL
ncbi:MAG: hypothetical protein J6A59_15905 [Lachnospiraceae bacterium]|nr:hypothetical protein [Lachnospiraceae bacterium]